MSLNPKKKFTDQITRVVQSEQQSSTVYPLIGIIRYVHSMYYADIEITGTGTMTYVPCHGYPVLGDSAIIHFIGGNSEMPVADCARRLAVGDQQLTEFLQDECYNYLDNGDFSNDLTGYVVTDASITGESYTLSDKACILGSTDNSDSSGSELFTLVDVSGCDGDYFKFQCRYKGLGSLQVEVYDAGSSTSLSGAVGEYQSGKLDVIRNVPTTASYDYKIWTSNSRDAWYYNKEAYSTCDETGEHYSYILLHISNVSESETLLIEDVEVTRTTPMIVSALLVYDENGDKEYYNSANDVVNNSMLDDWKDTTKNDIE